VATSTFQDTQCRYIRPGFLYKPVVTLLWDTNFQSPSTIFEWNFGHL